jgi:cell division protein FtsL
MNLKPIPINASETKGNVLELTVTIPNNARIGKYNFIVRGISLGPIESPVTSNATCTIVISEKPTNTTGGGCLDIALLLAVILCGVMVAFYLYRKYRKSSSIDRLTESEDAIEEFEEFVEEPNTMNDKNEQNENSTITKNISNDNMGNGIEKGK